LLAERNPLLGSLEEKGREFMRFERLVIGIIRWKEECSFIKKFVHLVK